MNSATKVLFAVSALMALCACATNRYAYLRDTSKILHEYEAIAPNPATRWIEREVLAYARFTGFFEWVDGRRYCSGDLDGDGEDDLVMLTCFESTGTWALQIGFVALSSYHGRVLTFESGELMAGTRWGDSVKIENGQIVVTGKKHGRGDLHTVPSVPCTYCFGVKGTTIEEEPNKAPPAEPGVAPDPGVAHF